jgi:protein-disulfide isomerase
MFTDLECPFCHRFYPGVQETLKNYPNKVRLIIKNFPLPFHPKARPAAKLALAANEQGKYKEMVEALMANGADYSESKVKDYAKDMGLNYNRLMADFKNNDAKYEAQIKEDEQLVESSEVRGTPTFFVNGKKVMVRDAAGYKEIIDKL